MNFNLRSVLAVSLITVAPFVGAYEYKHAGNPEQSDQFFSSVVKAMDFDVDMNRLQLQKMKKNLGRCLFDEIVHDVKSADLGMDTLVELVDVTYNYYLHTDYREEMMSSNDIDYVNMLNYSCIEQHPDKEQVVREYAYIQARSELEENCHFPDGARNLSCWGDTNRKYIQKYMNKHGL